MMLLLWVPGLSERLVPMLLRPVVCELRWWTAMVWEVERRLLAWDTSSSWMIPMHSLR